MCLEYSWFSCSKNTPDKEGHFLSNWTHLYNGRDSFQLFVGVFDTCLVWYLPVLPSETHAVANMTSLRAIDGDTSYHWRESFSLKPTHCPLTWARMTVKGLFLTSFVPRINKIHVLHQLTLWRLNVTSEFCVFCLITDKDGNNTVVVKIPHCITFACLWWLLTMDKIHMRTMREGVEAICP